METVENLDEISRAQAAAEGIPGRWQEVAELARRGLGAELVERAVH